MTLSDLIGHIITPFREIFFFHKKKALFFTLATVFFALLLFPYSDLTSFSQDQVNKNLKSFGGEVSYSEISLNLSPFGIKTNDFSFKTRTLKSPLKVGSITARPNLMSLLKLQPGGSIVLEKIFGGEANIGFGLGGKTNEKTNKFNFSADLEKIALQEILSFLGKPLKIEGVLVGSLQGDGEDSFRMQPKGDFKFNLENVVIPSEIPSPFGVMELPKKIKWNNSNIFGNFEKGRVVITNGTLGTKQAPVNGRFKGSINCNFTKTGNNIKQQCTDYNFKIELELDSNFQKNVADGLSSFLEPKMVNKTKLPGGGAKYLFSVQGNAMRTRRPPRFSRLNSFE